MEGSGKHACAAAQKQLVPRSVAACDLGWGREGPPRAHHVGLRAVEPRDVHRPLVQVEVPPAGRRAGRRGGAAGSGGWAGRRPRGEGVPARARRPARRPEIPPTCGRWRCPSPTSWSSGTPPSAGPRSPAACGAHALGQREVGVGWPERRRSGGCNRQGLSPASGRGAPWPPARPLLRAAPCCPRARLRVAQALLVALPVVCQGGNVPPWHVRLHDRLHGVPRERLLGPRGAGVQPRRRPATGQCGDCPQQLLQRLATCRLRSSQHAEAAIRPI